MYLYNILQFLKYKNRSVMKILPIVLLFGWSAMLIAQEDITFTASLSSDTVNLEQPFEITFTIDGKDAQNFEQPDFQGKQSLYFGLYVVSLAS